MLLTPYECTVLDMMLEGCLSKSQIASLKATHISGFGYTGAGNFIKLQHDSLFFACRTIAEPVINGYGDNYMVGFVLFIEDKQLTIECHIPAIKWFGISVWKYPLRCENSASVGYAALPCTA